ncbi:MAG: hypothetical protein K2X39_05935 [Silvanigrellaceae bacterium]|nr:hypothetical protein [Silvanigrellaceae bacterium]
MFNIFNTTRKIITPKQVLEFSAETFYTYLLYYSNLYYRNYIKQNTARYIPNRSNLALTKFYESINTPLSPSFSDELNNKYNLTIINRFLRLLKFELFCFAKYQTHYTLIGEILYLFKRNNELYSNTSIEELSYFPKFLRHLGSDNYFSRDYHMPLPECDSSAVSYITQVFPDALRDLDSQGGTTLQDLTFEKTHFSSLTLSHLEKGKLDVFFNNEFFIKNGLNKLQLPFNKFLTQPKLIANNQDFQTKNFFLQMYSHLYLILNYPSSPNSPLPDQFSAEQFAKEIVCLYFEFFYFDNIKNEVTHIIEKFILSCPLPTYTEHSYLTEKRNLYF